MDSCTHQILGHPHQSTISSSRAKSSSAETTRPVSRPLPSQAGRRRRASPSATLAWVHALGLRPRLPVASGLSDRLRRLPCRPRPVRFTSDSRIDQRGHKLLPPRTQPCQPRRRRMSQDYSGRIGGSGPSRSPRGSARHIAPRPGCQWSNSGAATRIAQPMPRTTAFSTWRLIHWCLTACYGGRKPRICATGELLLHRTTLEEAAR